MAKGQKKNSREARKDRTADRSENKQPNYMTAQELTASSKRIVPKKGGKA